jgi:hypothetical protein
MVMEVTNSVELMAVVDLAELVPLPKHVVLVPVPVFPTAVGESAVMMGVVGIHAENVQPPKHVPTECVLVLLPLVAMEELVVLTEPEEVVVLVPRVKDVAPVSVSAFMTARRETVVTQFNLLVPILVFALPDLVEAVLLDLSVEPKVVAQLLVIVTSLSQSLIAVLELLSAPPLLSLLVGLGSTVF